MKAALGRPAGGKEGAAVLTLFRGGIQAMPRPTGWSLILPHCTKFGQMAQLPPMAGILFQQ